MGKTNVLRRDSIIGLQRVGRETHAALARGIAHGRAPSKTGPSRNLTEWKREGIAKKHLSQLSTKLLAEDRELDNVSRVALAHLALEYSNVWELSQAARADLLKVPGVGPATLKKLRAYLVGKNAPVAWEA